MKRFYKDVAIAIVDEVGFEIHLDARPVRTPMLQPLQLPGKALAKAIAHEWDEQRDVIDVDTMPFTRIAATAVDRVRGDRKGYTEQIAAYAETDLVCYRAPAPSGLVVMQSRSWQPLLDWCRDTYGADLKVTEGVAPVDQDRAALDRLRVALDALDPFELAALSVATAASGSLVIGLALSQSRIDSLAAYEASQLDESYQNSLWGVDEEAQSRRDTLRVDLEAAEAFLTLLHAD
jgi:chaperone required for assembly of F1-ATPase